MTATATWSPEADTALRARLELFAGIGSDLGVGLPPLSAGDQWLPIVRGPSAAHRS